jgi:hypothetical protein
MQLFEEQAEFRTGENLRHVVARSAPGQDVKPGGLKTTNGLLERRLSREDFREAHVEVYAEVIGDAGVTQVAVD